MSGEPYIAAEDSAFFREALSSYSGESCLEIGAGNGGSLVQLSRRFGVVVGTDVVRPTMTDWGRKGADFVLAEYASCLRDSWFDLVALNPPYLGSEGTGDRAVDGGVELEVPMNFLREALRVVKRSGRVVMLVNHEARREDFERECSIHGFGLRLLAARRVFFEELSVYEASQQASRASPGVEGRLP